MAKLNLDRDQVDACRERAEALVRPVQRYVDMHSTLAVERAVLRMLGFTDCIEKTPGHPHPVSNLLLEVFDRRLLKNGAASLIASLKKKHPKLSQRELSELILSGKENSETLEELPVDRAMGILKPWVDAAYRHIDRIRYRREEMRSIDVASHPLKGVMVASGNPREDARQAQSAVELGADVIVVQRSTAQSLLDYVPPGETTEGFGGTFATQENFRIQRDFLNALAREQGRYIRLAQYSSGLCMPELSAMAAWEGVDFLFNDSLYGVLYRDINMKRTLIDQAFSREILARAGIVALTGEHNFLALGDACNSHHLVLASHFINEVLAKNSGMRDEQIGYSHAFEIDPDMEDGFLNELSMSQLLREVFPRSPLNAMPPSRHRQGDTLFNQALDALYCLCGAATGQGINMLSLKQPFKDRDVYQERFFSLKNANYVFQTAKSLADEIHFTTNGKVMRRARTVLDLTCRFLGKVREIGLMEALEQGLFLDVPRLKEGGRGYDGVFEKSRRYFNPFFSQYKGN